MTTVAERCRRFGGFAGSAYGEPLDATMSGARLGFSPWILNGCHWRIYGEESTENKKTKTPCCSCSFQERYQRNAYTCNMWLSQNVQRSFTKLLFSHGICFHLGIMVASCRTRRTMSPLAAGFRVAMADADSMCSG